MDFLWFNATLLDYKSQLNQSIARRTDYFNLKRVKMVISLSIKKGVFVLA
jgi:hypothetical protein